MLLLLQQIYIVHVTCRRRIRLKEEAQEIRIDIKKWFYWLAYKKLAIVWNGEVDY